MLCQFSVKNFKSFHEEATLDLQATSITEHEDNIIVDSRDGERFLPLAAVYGPNGSGKSNIISAFNALRNKIMRPLCAVCDNKDCFQIHKGKSPVIPFKFNSESLNEPTLFEVFFRTSQAEYKYNLSVKNEIILNESLSKSNFKGKNIIKLFTRENKNIKLNKSVFKKVSTSGITESLPLLSYLGITNKDLDVIKEIINWFEREIHLMNYGNPHNEANVSIFDSKKDKQLVLEMLEEMDIDIKDYRIEEKEDNDISVYFKHVVNNLEKELELHEESNGTIKLFGLLPFIINSINSGSTLIVDELDSKLHPKLLQYIIELFRDSHKNIKGAQLIFTSHDMVTMTSDLFRRDEIWFVAKNNEQSSQLYSLVEFVKENGNQPRKDEKFGKQYIEGRYGADPYLKRMINWEEKYESQQTMEKAEKD